MHSDMSSSEVRKRVRALLISRHRSPIGISAKLSCRAGPRKRAMYAYIQLPVTEMRETLAKRRVARALWSGLGPFGPILDACTTGTLALPYIREYDDPPQISATLRKAGTQWWRDVLCAPHITFCSDSNMTINK